MTGPFVLSTRAVRPVVALVGLAAVGLAGLAPVQAFSGSGPGGAVGTTKPKASATTASGPRLSGTSCGIFPADNYWNTDISGLPVHARSKDWMSHMSSTRDLHPDFGPSGGYPYGIPITVVSGTHAKVSVSFDYDDESDAVKYPLGSDTKIEGGPGAGGDRHAIVVDKDSCRVYETYATRTSGGRWYAGSGATWSLTSNKLRPAGWTSADAAGLPILPGLLRLSEVKAHKVRHAIRFTTNVTDDSYLWPARHAAGSVSSAAYPPMGARFRLKASFSTAGYRADTKAVLSAMKRYGLVLADNGSPWYFQGQAADGWPTGLLDELKSIPASAFEAVDTSSLRVSGNSAKAG
jgi:hypothetical protein